MELPEKTVPSISCDSKRLKHLKRFSLGLVGDPNPLKHLKHFSLQRKPFQVFQVFHVFHVFQVFQVFHEHSMSASVDDAAVEVLIFVWFAQYMRKFSCLYMPG